MLAKITLTLEQDEQHGTNAAMEETIQLLGAIEGLPTMKVVVTLECEEVIAPNYRDKLHAELRRRPIGIIAKLKTTTEDQITIVSQRTPMDDLIGGGIESVTLSSRGRTVTLDANTRRNAEAMLRNSGGGE